MHEGPLSPGGGEDVGGVGGRVGGMPARGQLSPESLLNVIKNCVVPIGNNEFPHEG